MSYQNQCKKRVIKGSELSTPILVPSFSSKGIRDIKKLHAYMKDSLTLASLVSAYDLYYNYINPLEIYESDVLFVDSGGYERDQEYDLANAYSEKYIPEIWTEEMHLTQIKKVELLGNVVLVNYDHEKKFTLSEQVERAEKFFELFPDFLSDFLCKPTNESHPYIDINNFCSNIQLMSSFSVIGFTEKELGKSILERCINIYKIRLELEKENIQTPIHIFGCLDPLNVLAYFMCGADIFDGLSWLRYSFENNVTTYLNSAAISSGKWHKEDSEMKVLSFSDNLQLLVRLTDKMNKFSEGYDWSTLGLEGATVEQLKGLIKRVEEMVGGK
ncbi:hypothetical protein CN285_27365 [Bacillus cereus]|nr:hypothetical protein CN285_27365 [Bacillus cereus]